MSYDKKCFELAASFLSDRPELLPEESDRTEKLAQAIQTTIEDTLQDFEDQDEAEARRFLADYGLERVAEDPTDPRSQAYAERMYEAADMERKRVREG